MTKRQKLRRLCLIAPVVLASTGFGLILDRAVEQRIDYAREAVGPIVIAVANDGLNTTYLDGIRLAVDQLNATDKGILGRPVKLLVRQGEGNFDDIRGIARGIATNPQVSAVLGHGYSSIALPASVIYETARILFMPPFASADKLTAYGFKYIFRMVPSASNMVAQSASIARLFGYRRIAVLHTRDEYSRELAFKIESAIRSNPDMDVVFRASFFAKEPNYRSTLAQLNGVDFDAVYLSTSLEAGVKIIRQMHELGVQRPIITSDLMAHDDLSKLTGGVGDRIIVPIIYSPDSMDVTNRRFKKDFEGAYGYPPDEQAAQGYDSVNVLASAIRKAGGTEPDVLATTLHWITPVGGVTGLYAYDPDGNLYGKSYGFRILRFGQWWDLPGVTAPYLLNSFREARREQKPQTPQNRAKTADQGAGGAVESRPATEQIAGSRQEIALAQRRARLSLAHELMGFERLGLIVTESKTSYAAEALAVAVAAENGFAVELCRIAAPGQGDENSAVSVPAAAAAAPTVGEAREQAAMNCASQLARTVDTLFVVPDSGLPATMVRRLNRALRSYNIPSFAIDDTERIDYGLSLTFTTPQMNLDEPAVAARFAGVLKNMNAGDLNERLTALPVVHVDTAGMVGNAQFDPRELLIVSGVLNVNSALAPEPVTTSNPTADQENSQ